MRKINKKTTIRSVIITYFIVVCQLVITLLGISIVWANITIFQNRTSTSYSSKVPLYKLHYSYNEKTNQQHEINLKKSSALEVISTSNAPVTLEDNYIIVDISEQIAYTFVNNELYKTYIISTGKETDEFRRAKPYVWKISYYLDQNLKPLYGPCLLGLDLYRDSKWNSTARALHGTDTPEILGKPESLGCIYFHNDDIIEICQLFTINDIVVTID